MAFVDEKEEKAIKLDGVGVERREDVEEKIEEEGVTSESRRRDELRSRMEDFFFGVGTVD